MKRYAIIVAGGTGTRMGADIPKQFLLLAGKPILMHTLERFADPKLNCSIVLVLPKDQIPFWKDLMQQHKFNTPHQIVEGGELRFDSVKNGISTVEEEDALVAIHDGVRPLITRAIIEDSFIQAEKYKSAVVSVQPKDSLRFVDEKGNKAVVRDQYRVIQTPQTFQLNYLREGYQKPYTNLFTDDAAVFESLGFSINLIDGSYSNLKITTPEDLLVAENILKTL